MRVDPGSDERGAPLAAAPHGTAPLATTPLATTAIVLGGGLAGSLLAALLSGSGVATVVVDAAPGRTSPSSGPVTPEVSGLLRLLGRRHGAPELTALASARQVAATGTPAAAQRGLGFVHHSTARQHPRRVNTFVPPKVLDAPPYLRHAEAAGLLRRAAEQRGATVLTGARVAAVELEHPEGPRVRLDDGRVLAGRLVLDTVGEWPGLPAAPPAAARTPERIAVAEFRRVMPYGATSAGALHDSPVPWGSTALHHLSPDGTLTVAPTGPDGSGDGAGPVAVTLRWTGEDGPGERFAALTSAYPDLLAPFDGAEQARPWTPVRPVRHGGVATPGYHLLPEPSGATDAFDRTLPALLLAASTVAAGAAASERGGTAPAADAVLAQETPELLVAAQDADDAWRAALRVAVADYVTWNAAFRVWAVGQIHGTVWAEDLRRRSAWHELLTGKHRGSPIPESDDYARLTRHLVDAMAGVAAGEVTPDDAAEALFGDVATAPCVPPTFGLADPARRHYVPSPPRMLRALRWARTPAAEAAVAARIAPTIRSLGRERVAGRIASRLKRA